MVTPNLYSELPNFKIVDIFDTFVKCLTCHLLTPAWKVLRLITHVAFGIGLESPRTTMFNMYYNGIKRTFERWVRGDSEPKP